MKTSQGSKKGKTPCFGEVVGISIGIDVSKNNLHCSVGLINVANRIKIGGSKVFDNTEKGFTDFVKWVSEHNTLVDRELKVCLEPTNTYHEKLMYSPVIRAVPNINFILIQPNCSKAYARMRGQNSKNDKADADILARMALDSSSPYEIWEALPDDIRLIRDKLRQRVMLLELKTATSNQKQAYVAGGLVDGTIVATFDQTLTFLNDMSEKIKTEVETLSKKNAVLATNVKRLETIPGVGFLTAITVLSEYNQFNNFNNIAQVVSWAGLDIVQKQSGNWVGKSTISKKGNSYIRRQLYCAAGTHIREKACYVDLHNKVAERIGEAKAKKYYKGVVAVMRKLLILCFSLLKNETGFNPEVYEARRAECRKNRVPQIAK